MASMKKRKSLRILKKANLPNSKSELLLIGGVTGRTRIGTLEKRYKADFRRFDENKGTAILAREKLRRKR